MSDHRLGSAIRKIRIRRRWRQVDVASRAGVSQSTVSRLERGHLDTISVGVLRRVAKVLDVRVDAVPRWRAGDLDRLLNARHSELHEHVAALFAGLQGWVAAPEVSFAVLGERGVIDLLAWHQGRNAILVIELKTEIADVNEMLGTLDRKRRLAIRVARERGWAIGSPAVSVWLVVAAGRTNRRRVDAHRAMLGAAFPTDGRSIRGWLHEPTGTVRCLSFWTGAARGTVRRERAA
jgi:transcriptional regulator with XRE-family HTH domain